MCNLISFQAIGVLANLVLAAQAAAAPECHIVLGAKAPPLEVHAAGELRGYLVKLYGISARITRGQPAGEGVVFYIGSPATNPFIGEWPKLSDQGLVVKRLPGARARFVVGGGSPEAALWAVYEFVEGLGVRFLLQGDVLPEKPAPFPPARLELVREPQLRFRAYRGINDLATSLVFYGLSDYRHLIDQLAKLRLNVFYVQTYPYQPFVHYQFRGQKKTTGVLHYGWKLPIHGETIGKALFRGRTEFTNPDFEEAATYEERVEAAQRHLHGLFAYAKSRGMKTGLMFWINQFTGEFNHRLPEWSDREYVSKTLLAGTRSARLGVSEDGVDAVAFPFLSPNNPVVMELNRTIIRAHADTYPEADFYGLFQPELPKSGDEYREIWARLSRKHGLDSEFNLDLMVAASKTNLLDAGVRVGDRPFHELQAAIGYAGLLDRLLNEDHILQDTANPNATVVMSTFSDEFYPVLPRIFPKGMMLMAQMDYTSSLAAKRPEMLRFAASSTMPVGVMASIADDNIGILPQMATPWLHQIFQAAKRYSAAGYFGRQFLVTKLEAGTAYIAKAAWSDITPQDLYRDQVENVCGRASLQPMLDAYKILEESTLKGDVTAMGFLFPVPGVMRKHWQSGAGVNKDWNKLNAYYGKARPMVQAALTACRPAGREYPRQLLGQLDFSIRYIEAVQEVRRASAVYGHARKAREAKDVPGYEKHIYEANRRLAAAIASLTLALESWAAVVKDPSDLGALALLNSYGLDYLKGVAHDVYLESQMWSIRY